MKKEFKGTKGEWRAVEYAGTYIIQDGETYEDNNILDSDIYTEEAVEANARLIASAPDLLEALQRCVRALKVVTSYGGTKPFIEMGEKAINKALGK